MSIYDDWSNVPGSIVVQNYNYSATSVALAVQTMQAQQPKNIPYPTAFEHIDNIRIPLKYTEPRQNASLGIVSSENTNEQSYCRMARQSYASANTLQAIGYMPRLCPVLLSVPELIDKYITINTDIMCNLRPEYKGELSGFTHERYDKEFVKSAYADYYVLTSAVIASNDSTSAKQITLATLTANNYNKVVYDTFSPWSGTFYNKYYRGFRPYILSNITDIRRITNALSYSGATGYCGGDNSVLFGLIDKGIVQKISPHYSSSCFTVPSGQYFRGMFLARTKSQWQKFFDASGMPWSYNLDDVLGQYDNNLRKPTTPGQPENPVDDGEGTGDNMSDEIEYPAVSYIPSAYTKYWITPETVIDLKTFLFSQTFFDNIQRLWENPGEYIVDCTYYPLNPAALGLMSADEEEIPVGNILSGVRGYLYPDTATAYHFAGKYLLEPYYNSYLDYAPYTSVSIYIPYIGIRPLDVSRITGHTLILAYSFDFNTRQITAHLGLDGNMTSAGGTLGNALDSFTGAFGVSFPFSGTQNNAIALNVLQHSVGAISSFGAMVGGVATGNIAAVAAGAIAAVNDFQKGNLSPETYGNLTPIAGLYNPQQPYLIINRPITAEPEGFKSKQGYASCYSGTVGEFSGFLQCAAVDVPSADTMTVAEQTEIEQLLLGGIYCG